MDRRAAALMLALLAVSCGDDPQGPGDTEIDWFPVEVGMSWHYSGTGYATWADTIDVEAEIDRTVLGDTTHDLGFQVFEVEQHYATTLIPDTGGVVTLEDWDTLYVAMDSAWARAYADLQTDEYELFLEFPLAVGDSWTVFQDSSVTATVESLDQDVTVPFGSFDCAWISRADSLVPDYSEQIYLADDVGIVRQVVAAPFIWGGLIEVDYVLETFTDED